MGKAIATVNLKVPSLVGYVPGLGSTSQPGPAMPSNWSSPTKGLTHKGKQWPRAGDKKGPGLDPVSPPQPSSHRTASAPLISALDGNVLRNRLKPIQAICPSRAAVHSVTQDTRFLEGVKGAGSGWAVRF